MHSMGRRAVVEFRLLHPQSSFLLTHGRLGQLPGWRGLMSDVIPEGDNIVDDRPADDKRILRTHLFLCHFTETGASPHFTQMYLLFQLQAGRRPAIKIMNFLGHILTTMPPTFVRATILSCRYSNTSSPPKLNVWGCGGSVGKFCKWILVLAAPLVGNVFH